MENLKKYLASNHSPNSFLINYCNNCCKPKSIFDFELEIFNSDPELACKFHHLKYDTDTRMNPCSCAARLELVNKFLHTAKLEIKKEFRWSMVYSGRNYSEFTKKIIFNRNPTVNELQKYTQLLILKSEHIFSDIFIIKCSENIALFKAIIQI